MWFLQNQSHADIRYYLPTGRDITIGRKDCDIIIGNDTSVSRRHAVLKVTDNTESAAVELIDARSKFGTLVNGAAVAAHTRTSLRCNDEVKFGQSPITGSFRLVFEPLVVCCSGMSSAEKNRVRQLVRKLGGEVVSGWNSRTSYLVMSSLTVTIKVVSALAHCRPIITPAWLEEAVRCVPSSKVWPNPNKYLPEVVDENLGSATVSFSPSYDRRQVFTGKTFYFLTEKQHSDLRLCVAAAGAKHELACTPRSVVLETLVEDSAVVLAAPQDVPRTLLPWITEVQQFLARHQCRCIQDCEIGFALLHKSIETYCNPRNLQDLDTAAVPLPPPSLSQMVDDYTQNSSHSQSHDNTIVDVMATPSHSGESGSDASAGNKISAEVILDGNAKPPDDEVIIISPSVSERESVKKEGGHHLGRRQQDSKTRNDGIGSSSPVARTSSTSKVSMSLKTRDQGRQEKEKMLSRTVAASADERDGMGNDSLDVSRNASILAPSSLTPSSLNVTSEEGRRAMTAVEEAADLPSRTVMANVFRGKRTKKRPALHKEPSSPAVSGEEERPAKKRCEEIDSERSAAQEVPGPGRISESSKVKATTATLPVRKMEDAHVENVPGLDDGCSSEMQHGEVMGSSKSFTCKQSKDDNKGSKKLESALPAQKDSSSADRHTAASPSQNDEESGSEKESLEYSLNSHVSSKDDVLWRDRTPLGDTLKSTQRTPARSVDMSCSSFLSARGTRSKKALLQPPPAGSSSDASQSLNPSLTQTSVASGSPNVPNTSFTALSLNQHKEVLPLSAISRGHRRKATPSRLSVADAMWLEEDTSGAVGGVDGKSSDGEDEDPFEDNEGESFPSNCYEPVRDSEGFIKAREMPKLKMSRSARLSLHARSDFDLDAHTRSLCGPLLSQAVEVELAELMVNRNTREDRSKRYGRIRGDTSRTGLRDFKRFRKTSNGSSLEVRRKIALMMYVPVVSHVLPDWDMEEAEREVELEEESGSGSRMTPESQDFNVFVLDTRKRKRR